MIDFNVKELVFPKWIEIKKEEPTSSPMLLKNSFEEIVQLLRTAKDTVKNNFIRVGYLLYCIKRGDLYQFAQKNKYDTYAKFYKDSFELFCKDYLGLCKSTVYGLINVYETFGDGLGNGVRSAYKDYSYSQLIELLPLTVEQRALAKSTMTVKEIRALKKGESTLLPAEEKTSAPPVEKKDKYEPFKVLFSDRTKFKHALTSRIAHYYNHGAYEITCNGRKQNVDVFIGSLSGLVYDEIIALLKESEER